MRFLGIQGIGQYSNFQNNYRINDIPRVNVEEVNKQDNAVAPQESKNLTPILSIDTQLSDQWRKSINPNDISVVFNKNDDFSYIGRDKDVESLDIEKAISDMRQDSILQEYQYFVGSVSNVFHSEDGTVLSKL